jgi:predicted nucleic acid-binding protein
MSDYILDVDHIVGLMAGDAALLSHLRGISDGRFGVTVTTLGELYFLVRSSAQMDANAAALTEMVADLRVWDYDRGAAEITGEILTQARALSRPITLAEAQIAAVARQRQAVLLSGSKNLAEIRDVVTQNWLEPAQARQ